jgi:hypothetical protein
MNFTFLKLFKQPIFIIGCCNSGTTILWRSLLTHNDMNGPDCESQDLEDLPKILKQYLGNETFRLWAHSKFGIAYYYTEKDYREEDANKVYSVFAEYVKNGERLIAKSPPDTLRARLLQSYFPDAYFLAIVRDPYAISEGIIRKREFDPERPRFKGLKTTINEAAEQWYRANTMILSHEKYLKNYLILKYEDLINETQTTFSKILNFCELDITSFKIPTFDKNLNAEQISRLTKEEIDTITSICGPLMLHFDYDILNSKGNIFC